MSFLQTEICSLKVSFCTLGELILPALFSPPPFMIRIRTVNPEAARFSSRVLWGQTELTKICHGQMVSNHLLSALCEMESALRLLFFLWEVLVNFTSHNSGHIPTDTVILFKSEHRKSTRIVRRVKGENRR